MRGQTAIVMDLTRQGSHFNVAEVYTSVEPKTLRFRPYIEYGFKDRVRVSPQSISMSIST